MEPDVSVETSAMIRIAIIPIGKIPHQTLRDYYSMFLHHHTIPLSSISSFYTEEQKSPFTNQPWETVEWELGLEFYFACGPAFEVNLVLPNGFDFDESEVIKAKKRRLGRAQKTIGDYCLLAGSPVDANAHYSTALELARLTADYFWYAGALEGSVCALLIDQLGLKDPSLEDEVRYRYSSVILHYKKSFIPENAQRVSPLSFELEANLKLARYLCRRELAKEVVDLLTSAADGAKSLIDATDRLILYVEIARLFGTLGYQRKAAFFSRQSRASISNNSHTNEVGSSHADSGKMHHQSVVSLFESQWSTLQMVVLREILLSAVRAGDPLAAWSAAARLLRSYYPQITPAGQNGLARALANSSEMLPSGIRCSDPALPFVRLYSFPLHPSQMDIIKCNPAREDWWAGSAPSGPFIYTPFSKGEPNDSSKQDLIWIVGEPVHILVELANPCGFNLRVDSIYLSVHSGNFDPFPISLDLPPNSSKVITLSGIPTSVGPVTIPGCTVHCFGVITEHLFRDVDNLLHGAAQGLVLSDPFRCCGSPKLKNVSVPNISVVPPLPLLVSHVVGGDGAIVLYEGEIREIHISLANAGTVPVDQAHISLSGKNQDSVLSISYETLKSMLPLKPGAEVILPVTLKAWKLGLVDLDNASGSMGRQLKDSSSPSLLIHYAGPLTDCEDPPKESAVAPGRRLVVPLNMCVLQGLSFVKARLLSMEIPAHVGENLPKPVYLENSASKEGVGSETKMDGLLDSTEDKLSNGQDATEYGYPKTRIDRDFSARVLIPLEHFKLPILDGSFFMKDFKPDGAVGSRNSSFSEKSAKAELKASINNLISRIKVRWQSGRTSSGELNIKDAIQAALKTSAMDVLLPDPLTFGFRLVRDNLSQESGDSRPKGSVLAHDMTPMEIVVRNNTKEMIRMSLNITCRDVAGENCVEGTKATVLWSGVLNGIAIDAPPLQESKHSFSLYFLVPGEYSLVAAALIEDATDLLRARAKTNSPDEPIFCRGPPFHVRVIGTA
ncbi:TRAFFICKING PROTEIN PARTICLE COMPLEX SUBUNIT 9 [Salix purpurea]|uniref:TRAFFICKING PROTEIN PARTICLE COMPLEX SUBUNIT 9 n=1 Tax=Salix purpurea TaxID=77065 RepID=A0A9Q0ULV9_SALPP|nr:TRAFFICKING PROTEIN PARTICLE COMPLEX SUBUNIT 9 [Salix purpurea]